MNASNLKKMVNELTDIVYKERKTVSSVLLLAIIFKLMIYWLDREFIAQPENLDILLSKIQPEPKGEYPSASKLGNTSTLFQFYPATASHEELVQLGFSSKTSSILINYRTKGGQFRTKEDVRKIYGVTPELYQRLVPFILIKSETSSYSKYNNTYAKKEPKVIDINTASLEEWKALPGIGDYFAEKFVEKRIGLGAYIDIAQVAEVYKFPDSSFHKIEPYLLLRKAVVKKLNINTAPEDLLRKHPYILKWQADDILRHRPIYGLDDLFDLKTYSDKAKHKFVENYFEF